MNVMKKNIIKQENHYDNFFTRVFTKIIKS